MLDIISMVILVGILLFAILMLFIIKGGSMNKSDYERRMEDEEQMKFLREWNEKKSKK